MQTEATVEDAVGFYPGGTVLSGQVSILLLGFRHAVTERNFGDWFGRVERLGWLAHPYLMEDPAAAGVCGGGRSFAPHAVLTRSALETVFGHTWGKTGGDDPRAERRLLEERISSRRGAVCHCENLLLTRDPGRCSWLCRPLRAQSARERAVVFDIEWADLWLFDDESGLIALKVRVDHVVSPDGDRCLPTLSDLSALHRYLRDWQDPAVTLRPVGDDETPRWFWEDVVFGEWLGANQAGEHLLMRDGTPSREVFDDFSRYCKLLTGAQMQAPVSEEEEFAWSSPFADPLSGYAYRRHFEEVQRGEWRNTILAFQAAIIAGYPTYRDLFLFELATASNEGAAWGHDGDREWQYSIEYVRGQLDEGGIEIWDCWAGLALRDVCAFLAWDDSMPLLRRGQLEARYYPLYVHAYHLRLELDHIAANCVDHDLVDSRRLRMQLRRFETFRSRYWFKEVTRDFQGVEVFGKMKQGMQIDALFDAVSEEVREVGDYLEGMVERGRQALITLLVAAAYPIYLWYRDAGEQTWIAGVLDRYQAFNAENPGLALMLAILVTAVLFVLLGLIWTRLAPSVAKVVQRVYAYLERHRSW